ncbi:hypothetical protein [Gordonia sp. (in: high G+C Gram-positive bacteria)]|uniref:hypothetical protein n=1 Tax=Gordonia sp. (in: high G+C Gram-positive bacteria) TaxID=84139 RepID=UPI003C71FAFA
MARSGPTLFALTCGYSPEAGCLQAIPDGPGVNEKMERKLTKVTAALTGVFGWGKCAAV